MNEKSIFKLTAYFLNDLYKILSNRGCNDTTKEVDDLVNKIGENEIVNLIAKYGGYDVDTAEFFMKSDYVLARTLADYFLDKSKE